MTSKINMIFRNVPRTNATVALVEERYARIKRLNHKINRCNVVLELPHKRRSAGNDYHVRVDITIPRAEIVGHSSEKLEESFDLNSAINNAFTAVERQLRSRRSRRIESRTTPRDNLDILQPPTGMAPTGEQVTM